MAGSRGPRVAALAAAVTLACAGAAEAAEQQAVANSPTAFTTPEIIAFQGDSLRFTNLDPVAGHDLDSVSGLFGSPVIPFGQSVRVSGVQALKPGTYPFLCSVHPNMRGNLRVQPSGLPALPGLPAPPEPPEGGDGPPTLVDLLPKAPVEPLGAGEWPSYGHDLSNTRDGGDAGPSPDQARTLAPVWTFRSSDGDFTGTPVVADGTLFAGSSGGTLFAFDAATGDMRWSHDFNKPINASAAVSGGAVYIPLVKPGSPSVAKLDASNGTVLWETVTDTQPTADSYASPTVWDGKVFIGTSGYFGEQISEVDVQARGSIAAIDAASGEVLWKTFTVPPGHDGGAVWSTAAVDPETRRLYIGTGNAYHDPAGDMTDSMVAIDADTGAVVDWWQSIAGDAWNGAEDWPENPDADFGASANLFTDESGRKLVGQGEKSGEYHALDRASMDPVWRAFVGPGHFTGGVIGSTAYDGDRIYGPNTQAGLVWALRPGGELAWVSSDGSPTVHFGAVSVANGVVYSNDVTGFMTARDVATGLPLARLPLGAPAWGGISIAGGSVFTNTGTGGTDGIIVAFRPRG